MSQYFHVAGRSVKTEVYSDELMRLYQKKRTLIMALVVGHYQIECNKHLSLISIAGK